jgi:glycosyltransferase involved in cell wall biosynthesis
MDKIPPGGAEYSNLMHQNCESTTMRIALNAWFMDQPTTGSGQYLAHLLAEYAAHPLGHRFLLCGHAGTQPPADLASPHFEWQALRTPFDAHRSSALGRHLAKVWFEQQGIPRACRRWGADLVHVPYWASPLFCRIPAVVTIHDLIPTLLPAYRGGALGRLYNRLVTLSARRAAYVLTDSHASRQDIVDHLGIPPQRVEAIPLAAGSRFRPVRDPQVLEHAKRKYGLDSRYWLYLGGFDVRKNVPAILRAYARLDRTDLRLVIAGRLPTSDTPFTPHPRRVAGELGISERVHLTGWVDEEDKPALYTMAAALVFPSSYEGFGLPPLEAMSCGTPAIVSDRGSLPEVVGPGGLCVDPDDIEALAGAMREIAVDVSLYERMRAAALQQAARFSWAKTAQATLSAYGRCHAQAGQGSEIDALKGALH